MVMIGVQGSGKGTQAQFLTEKYGIPQISTGDLFRAMRTQDTPLAREVQEIMAQGQLISDDLTNRVVEARLQEADAQKGAIFDGYPRTIPQAEALDKLLAAKGEKLQLVLVLDLEREVAIKRIEGRRYSQDMKRVYNVYFSPPKQEGVDDVDGLPLVQRPDDNRAAVEKRINDFYALTSPLIDYYRGRGIVHKINANQSIEAVCNEILAAVEASGKSL